MFPFKRHDKQNKFDAIDAFEQELLNDCRSKFPIGSKWKLLGKEVIVTSNTLWSDAQFGNGYGVKFAYWTEVGKLEEGDMYLHQAEKILEP